MIGLQGGAQGIKLALKWSPEYRTGPFKIWQCSNICERWWHDLYAAAEWKNSSFPSVLLQMCNCEVQCNDMPYSAWLPAVYRPNGTTHIHD
jgi:hypothetical protein